ncbi:hypothetical protein P171DRAFT_429813 [Karstenula rhodostoma CBS 690.94]|uniref:Uncharacterized protein n=1 Tax=Karstenula rhodostoma CBS 690.94 TaxID=1392251 RepID=A0A9P4UF47_9PLEO|nr:hypothetical protein P171DRAFT_429813 [Karstenula rhodostoma CBS 690.94]
MRAHDSRVSATFNHSPLYATRAHPRPIPLSFPSPLQLNHPQHGGLSKVTAHNTVAQHSRKILESSAIVVCPPDSLPLSARQLSYTKTPSRSKFPRQSIATATPLARSSTNSEAKEDSEISSIVAPLPVG